MRDPLDMTVRQLMEHSRRDYRDVGYEAAHHISVLQLEDQASSIPLFVERQRCDHLVKDNFKPLS